MLDTDTLEYWLEHTTLKGTVSRLRRYVYGDCAKCDAVDVLVYDTYGDETLLCADCARRRAVENPRIEVCDGCGAQPAWRDPKTGKNEFYCMVCHVANGAVFQNRWARVVDNGGVRTGRVLGIHDKAKCEAAGYGTDCKGEIKPRGGEHKGMLLCNKHAGKKSAGPEYHQ